MQPKKACNKNDHNDHAYNIKDIHCVPPIRRVMPQLKLVPCLSAHARQCLSNCDHFVIGFEQPIRSSPTFLRWALKYWIAHRCGPLAQEGQPQGPRSKLPLYVIPALARVLGVGTAEHLRPTRLPPVVRAETLQNEQGGHDIARWWGLRNHRATLDQARRTRCMNGAFDWLEL